MIVVGVDGSEASKETLRFAVNEAKRWKTSLHVVHAFWEWEPVPGTDQIEQEREPLERESWLSAIIREVVGDIADIEITMSTVDGDAAPVLLEAARNADLLIVGSRGQGGFTGLLLGSVSQQCAHHATCPIVIVRGSHPAGPARP
jgi:nucleotide-binding universal stress UspA family protein